MKRIWTALCTTLCLMLFVTASVAQKSDKDKVEPEKCPEPIYKWTEVKRKARIKHREEPDYTKEAWRRDIKGMVVLRAVLCVTGKVTNIEVIRSLPYGLTENAIKATRKIKFKPAEKDGHPVSTEILCEFYFYGRSWHH